jgi:hypothetical protein
MPHVSPSFGLQKVKVDRPQLWEENPADKRKANTMFLVLFAAVGFLVGYRLEMTRSGYLVMALTAAAFFGGEIVHILTATNRASLTMLPLVIGLLLTTFMLAGALVRLVVGRFSGKA